MSFLLLGLAILVGLLVPTQIGLNGRLAVILDNPIIAALISFSVGAITLLLFTSVTGMFSVVQVKWSGIPYVYFAGGLIGAVIVSASSYLAPLLGSTTYLSIAIASQLLFSLVLDIYGLAGFEKRAFAWQQLVGVIMLICGTLLVVRYRTA